MTTVSDQSRWLYLAELDVSRLPTRVPVDGSIRATDPGGEFNLLRELGVEAPLIFISPDRRQAKVIIAFDNDTLGRADGDESYVLGLGREALRRLQAKSLAPTGQLRREIAEWGELPDP